MFTIAQSAIDHSGANDDALVYCANTEDNLSDLRMWAAESRRTGGNAYGETATAEGRKFEGYEQLENGDVLNWTVVVLDA
jgi:hypothetical protein